MPLSPNDKARESLVETDCNELVKLKYIPVEKTMTAGLGVSAYALFRLCYLLYFCK